MTITFYYMEGCGYCRKAKELLSDPIAKGEVIVVSSTKAPPGVRGFPHFTHGDKQHSGLPQSTSALYKKLGYTKESYKHPKNCVFTPDCATLPRWPGKCNMYTDKWWKAGVF